jgi:hypothetical protein
MKDIVNNSWQATNHDALAGILPQKQSQTNLSFGIEYPGSRNGWDCYVLQSGDFFSFHQFVVCSAYNLYFDLDQNFPFLVDGKTIVIMSLSKMTLNLIIATNLDSLA